MKCPIETQENADLLLAYCARRLDLDTRLILEKHIEMCPACQEFQRAQQAVWEALDAWEAEPVSPDFDRRLYRRIEQEGSWWTRFTRPLRPMLAPVLVGRGVPIAAAACLLVLAGVLLERPGNVIVPQNTEVRVEAIQPDQVERVLDDMDMLRQFRLATTQEANDVNAM